MEGHRNSVTGQARIEGVALQAGDIHGGVHVHSHAPALLPVPQQLPPAPAHLLGREAELAALDRELNAPPLPGGRCLVLAGPAGVGKSALAGSWLRSRAEEFPDGLFYADLRSHAPGGPTDPVEVLGAFLRALGLARVPAELHEAAALWRSAAASRRIGVLLDSAATAAQVRALLPGADRSVTVVTSRTRLDGLSMDGAELFPVGLIDRAAATELLTRRIGAERVAAELPAVEQVVSRCAGLPLAICVAGARMASRPRQPLAATAEALRREADRLAALRLDGESAVRGALDASYRVLDRAAGRLYRLLGQLPLTEFTPESAGAAAELSRVDADATLDLLAGTHLLEERGDGRYRFHDLVRLHARELGRTEDPPEQCEAAVRRVGEHYLAVATAAEALIMPSHRRMARDYQQPPLHVPEFAEETEALGWFDRERDQLMAVLRDATRNHRYTLTWQLADAMQPMFVRLRPHAMQLESNTLGLAAARKVEERIAEQRMLTSLGQGRRNAGRIQESADWFAQALVVAEELDDRKGKGQALIGLGHAHRDLGELDSARARFEQALVLWEAIGYRRGVGLLRVALGEVATDAADEAEAERQLSTAIEDFTAVGDQYEVCRAQAIRGRAYLMAGRYGRAGEELEIARAGFVAAGAPHWQARSIEWLGELALAQGETGVARERFTASYELYRSVAAPDTARLARRIEELPTG
ncbi:tetratricopeptide repeat protein [Kitasatospora griseola]|uniref:tetratricopeptide repeat protein n=1 Tax=Kitasatospora griseola TaxID=2064 RepID=UPI0037FFFA0F